jgi:hypothetical protein
MERINEGTTLRIQVLNLDSSDAPVTPTTLRYRLDCRTTGREIVGWTSLTADDTVDITVTAAQNDIQNRSNTVERKTLTVEADTGLSTAFSDDYDFEVRRMSGF